MSESTLILNIPFGVWKSGFENGVTTGGLTQGNPVANRDLLEEASELDD